MYELIKDVDKKMIYDSYIRIINDTKPYKKITTKEITNDLIEYYSNYNNILDICSYSEIRLLNKVLKEELSYDEILKDKCSEDLRFKCLILYDKKKSNLVVPKELKEPVATAYKSINRELAENLENLNIILVGIFKIYGMLTFDELHEILINYLVIDKEVLRKHILKDKYFSFHVKKIIYKKEEFYIYRFYEEIKNILYVGIKSLDDADYFLRPFEELIYLRYNDFNDMNKDILEMEKELVKHKLNNIETVTEISFDIVIDDDRKTLFKKLKSYGDDFIKILDKAMDNMPSACLKGYTRKEYLDYLSAKKKYQEEESNPISEEEIDGYKKAREKAKNVMDEAMYFAFKTKFADKFNDAIKKNNIFFTETDTGVVTNLVLFHSLGKEKSNFDVFFEKNVNVFYPKYELFKEFKDSYIEGLFKITEINKKGKYVMLKNNYSKREYKVYDIALSNNKSILNDYIYTSIVTIDGYTFTTDYISILGDDKKVLEEIEKKKNTIKDITSDVCKEFLVTYEIFRDTNINIDYRNID